MLCQVHIIAAYIISFSLFQSNSPLNYTVAVGANYIITTKNVSVLSSNSLYFVIIQSVDCFCHEYSHFAPIKPKCRSVLTIFFLSFPLVATIYPSEQLYAVSEYIVLYHVKYKCSPVLYL